MGQNWNFHWSCKQQFYNTNLICIGLHARMIVCIVNAIMIWQNVVEWMAPLQWTVHCLTFLCKKYNLFVKMFIVHWMVFLDGNLVEFGGMTKWKVKHKHWFWDDSKLKSECSNCEWARQVWSRDSLLSVFWGAASPLCPSPIADISDTSAQYA